MEKESVANGPIFDSVLKRLYYTPKEGSSYGGVKALYKAAKQELPQITLKQVNNFLHEQNVYTDHKNPNRNFDRRMYVASSPKSIWGLDLVCVLSLKKYNHGFSYILTAVDFFSRQVFNFIFLGNVFSYIYMIFYHS